MKLPPIPMNINRTGSDFNFTGFNDPNSDMQIQGNKMKADDSNKAFTSPFSAIPSQSPMTAKFQTFEQVMNNTNLSQSTQQQMPTTSPVQSMTFSSYLGMGNIFTSPNPQFKAMIPGQPPQHAAMNPGQMQAMPTVSPMMVQASPNMAFAPNQAFSTPPLLNNTQTFQMPQAPNDQNQNKGIFEFGTFGKSQFSNH